LEAANVGAITSLETFAIPRTMQFSPGIHSEMKLLTRDLNPRIKFEGYLQMYVATELSFPFTKATSRFPSRLQSAATTAHGPLPAGMVNRWKEILGGKVALAGESSSITQATVSIARTIVPSSTLTHYRL